MNDDHGDDFLRTQFLVDHPEWRLGTERYRGLGAMDFGRDEVRDYTFRLIEESVRRYDCDGIELDFNRFPNFFKDGAVDERVAKMNSLVERVHKLLDDVGRERGPRLVLAVRVPSNYGRTAPTPETARQLGCDVPACLVLNALEIFSTEPTYPSVKFETPDVRNFASWQGGTPNCAGETPTKNATWGSVKALYR